MSRFKWLGGIIPYTFGIVFIIIGVVIVAYSRPTCCGRRQEHPQGERARELAPWQRYFYGYGFEYVYQSAWKDTLGHELSMYILLLWRLAAFCFFLAIPFIYDMVKHGGNVAMFFTDWNVYLITLYFFLASVASVIGIMNDESYRLSKIGQLVTPASPKFWSTSLTEYGYAVQILFEVAGSMAFLVTFVAFALFMFSFNSFWEVSEHFMNTVVMLFELLLNRMMVRWEHLPFTLCWGLMYCIFIWPMVATGAATRWPYPIMNTDNSLVFGWFAAAFVGITIFYYIFWFVDFVKWKIAGQNEEQNGETKNPARTGSHDVENQTQRGSSDSAEKAFPKIDNNSKSLTSSLIS